MATYIVSYDLIAPGKNYDNLINALKSYPDWCHALKSTWCVRSDMTAVQVRDHLVQHIDKNDKLMVVLSGGIGAWSAGFSKEVSDWMKTKL